MIDRSPYEIVLGQRIETLHPRLRTYFGAIPRGCVGVGIGVFDRVGTRRRWLWPVLALLARQNVLFPVCGERVPFEVQNRPVYDSRGDVSVTGRRAFHLVGGDRTMIDAITAVRDGDSFQLDDILGPDRRMIARLEATVHRGELHLASTRVSLRIGRRHLHFPRAVAPVVRLRERFDDDLDHQHVTVTVDMPIIGRIYEYSGAFTYDIRPATSTTSTSGEPAP